MHVHANLHKLFIPKFNSKSFLAAKKTAVFMSWVIVVSLNTYLRISSNTALYATKFFDNVYLCYLCYLHITNIYLNSTGITKLWKWKRRIIIIKLLHTICLQPKCKIQHVLS